PWKRPAESQWPLPLLSTPGLWRPATRFARDAIADQGKAGENAKTPPALGPVAGWGPQGEDAKGNALGTGKKGHRRERDLEKSRFRCRNHRSVCPNTLRKRSGRAIGASATGVPGAA